MSSLENKLLVQRAASIWSTKDFDMLHEVYSKDCIERLFNKIP